MIKKVVIACDGNLDYLTYLPVTLHLWARLDYHIVLLFCGERNATNKPIFNYLNKYWHSITIIDLNVPPTILSSTFAQVSRFFGFRYAQDNDFLLISDADLLPFDRSYYSLPELQPNTVFLLNGDAYYPGKPFEQIDRFPMTHLCADKAMWTKLFKSYRERTEISIARIIRQYIGESSIEVQKNSKNGWNVDEMFFANLIKTADVNTHLRRREVNGTILGNRLDRVCYNPSDLKDLQKRAIVDAHWVRPLFDNNTWSQTFSVIEQFLPDSILDELEELQLLYANH